MGKAAPEIAHQCLGKEHQALGDAGVVHDLARQDEKRHGEEGEAIETGEETIGRHRQKAGAAGVDDPGDAGNAEHEADRHADRQEDEEDDHNQDHGFDSGESGVSAESSVASVWVWSSLPTSRMPASTIWTQASSAETGTEA